MKTTQTPKATATKQESKMELEDDSRPVDVPVTSRNVALTPRTPADILIYAMDSDADVATIRDLMDLQMRWDAEQARKAYVDDMAKFKLTPIEIIKEKPVCYKSTDGNTTTSYKHATLGNVTRSIVPGLAAHGFSHHWDTQQQAGGMIAVSCVITHRLGHSETTTLISSRDESGKKNNIQAMSSTITYLQRYTILAATGLATQDDDDDGRGAELDVTLADNWIRQAQAAKTTTDLEKVWFSGNEAISEAGDTYALKEFMAAVNAHKLKLANPARTTNSGTGGRMSRIIEENT